MINLFGVGAKKTIIGALVIGVLAVSGWIYFSGKVSVERQESEAAANGIWISSAEVQALPMSGSAWNGLKSAADNSCGTPDLANQDDSTNVCVMAKALVFARTRQETYRSGVVSALTSVVNSGTYNGRALALGRELAAYVISADLIDLKNFDVALDTSFRAKIRSLLTTPTSGHSGATSLVHCHEDRPNNWGTHCGASRLAVYAYLGDTAGIARVAQLFKGWLGDRSLYSGFGFRSGELDWQCNPSAPVGINPTGCTRDGHSIDGVLPDDQRRAGGFTWPPPKENYVWEALQGAVVQAVILKRAGYDVFTWENQALRRAVEWLHSQANFPAVGDDTWTPHLINYYYGTQFPAPVPTSPGKNMGWTDWTHSGSASNPSPTNTSDLNTDGKVDVIDLGILLSSWGQTTKPKADINQDAKVDVVDLGILLGKWGSSG